MTEYITKEQALEAVTRNLALYGDEWIAAYNIVSAIPPADVVPVVRCKDCENAIMSCDEFGNESLACEI